MTTEIRIRYDGDAYGLADGRLSLGAFLPALGELLTALRRIGSDIVVKATKHPERGRKGGRLAKEAEVLDLSLQSISHNCVVLDMLATSRPTPGDSRLLFDDLPETAGYELLESIDAESKGRQRNWRVSKYLKKLPAGVRSQEYRLFIDGTERKVVRVEDMIRHDETSVLPGLAESVGTLVGVIFHPPQVRLKLADGVKHWCHATQDQVEYALDCRQSPIRVLTVHGITEKPKVIRISSGDEPFTDAGVDATKERLFVDWAEVMRRLS